MNNILVTGGCSFSSEGSAPFGLAWPQYLKEIGKFDTLYNQSRPAQSNKLISLQVKYKILELLKKYDAKDLTVGIMWTGLDRNALLTSDDNYIDIAYADSNRNGKDFLVPFNFLNDTDEKWIPLLQDHPNLEILHKPYYSRIYKQENAIVDYLIQVKSMQDFLSNLDINYFMSTAWNLLKHPGESWWNTVHASTVKTLEKTHFTLIENNRNYKWLLDSIDLKKFIPVEGLWEYCYKINPGRDRKLHHHPIEKEHLKFTEEYIIPYINNKKH